VNGKTLDVNKPQRDTQDTVGDSPNVLVFPPALPVGALLLGLFLGRLWPWSLFGGAAPVFWIRATGFGLAVLGAALLIWGRTAMVRAGTNVPPNKPTVTIVTAGPFRFTRNPLYLGGSLVYLGLAMVLGSAWLLWLFVPMVLVLRWGIHREERYLEAKFGEVYVAYKARVRRWL
jgi:protein-S-isoprenylcysteine O-methyltransferase Ste14